MLRITLLSALFVLLIGDAVAADTIRVPDDFATIQEAVNFAAPGDRVLIVSGSYTESVVISTNRLTLIGEDDTEIVGIPGGEAVTVEADRVALKNLTITGMPDVAISVADCENVTIRRCVISGATKFGIQVLNSTNTRILINRISGVLGAAISLGDIDLPAQESTDSRVFANRIIDAGMVGIDSAGGTNRIARNRVEGGGGDLPESTAIRVQGSGATVLRNRISLFAGSPLGVEGDGHRVSNNVFEECSYFAVVFGMNHLLRRNRFDGSALFIEGTGTEVINNFVRSAPGIGISVAGTMHLLKKNKVRDSGADGICILGSLITVQANKVSDSGRDGIDIESGTMNTVLKNFVTRSATDGIEADVDATNCLFQGNKVTDVGENGFHIRSGGHTLKKNSATSSGDLDLRSAVEPGANTYIGNNFQTNNLNG